MKIIYRLATGCMLVGFALVMAACGTISGTDEEPTATQTVALPPTQVPTRAPAVTIHPPPAPEPTANLVTFRCEETEAESTWCLLDAGEKNPVSPPTGDGQLYDYYPLENQALYGSHFPTSGAGPGNLAVTDLMVWDLKTGETRPVVEEERVVKAAWGPRGEIAYLLATETTNELRWRSPDEEEIVLAVDIPHLISVSPSGQEVAFARESRYNLGGEPGLYIVDVDSGEERMVSEADRSGTGGADFIRWSPDEAWLLMPVSQQLLLAATDGSVDQVLAYDEPLAEEPWAERLPTNVLWQPQGTKLVASVETGGPGLPEPVEWLILLIDLDLANGRILAGQVAYEGGLLIGWDVPGESVWVNQTHEPGTPLQVPLPE